MARFVTLAAIVAVLPLSESITIPQIYKLEQANNKNTSLFETKRLATDRSGTIARLHSKKQPVRSGTIARLHSKKQPVVETTHESWLQKMGNAMVGFCFGIVLIIFSFPVMWINERRAAKYESLIEVGKAECTSIRPDKANTNLRGTLVHVNGGKAEGKALLQDQRFKQFYMNDKCLRMRSSVQAYQWTEQSRTEEKKDLVGGGTTTTKKYTYKQTWSDGWIDSSAFQDKSKQNKLARDDVVLGTVTLTSPVVHFGDSFTLDSSLVEQLYNFQDAGPIVGDTINRFQRNGDYYYFPQSQGGSEPRIGDMRAKFEYIPDSPVTAIALQVESENDTQRDTFLPYRMVSRGFLCFRATEEELRMRRTIEGKKDPNELYNDDKCDLGPLNCLCFLWLCVCNCVIFCFAGLGPPEVYHLFHSELSAPAVWRNVKSSAGLQKWVLRVIGWLMLFIGFMLLFGPLFSTLDLLPFLGPTLSNIASSLVAVLSCILTVVIACIVMSAAYLVYRPLLGFMYLIVASVVIVVPLFVFAAVR